MRKSILIYLFLFVSFQNSVIAQDDNSYIQAIEEVLTFEKSDLKKIRKSDNLSKLIDDIHKNLDQKLKSAKKLSKNPDSITTKTIQLLEGLKPYTKLMMDGVYDLSKSLDGIDKKLNSSETLSRDIDSFIKILDDYSKFQTSIIDASIDLNNKSLELFNKTNTYRESIGLVPLAEETSAFTQYGNTYLSQFFKEMKDLSIKKENKKKQIEIAKQTIFNNQAHRFQFINGILHYNNSQLSEGQSISEIEEIFGTDYIETQKADGKFFRIIRYRNSPISMKIYEGKVRAFYIHVTNRENENELSTLSILGNSLVELENYYFNSDTRTLFPLEYRIEKNLDRYFIITYASSNLLHVSYGDSNDFNKALVNRSFLVYINSDFKIMEFTYSELVQ